MRDTKEENWGIFENLFKTIREMWCDAPFITSAMVTLGVLIAATGLIALLGLPIIAGYVFLCFFAEALCYGFALLLTVSFSLSKPKAQFTMLVIVNIVMFAFIMRFCL